MIAFAPDDDELLLQETTRAFAQEQLRPRLRAHEEARAVAPEIRAAFHELGLTGCDLPEALGFGGLSLTARALIEEELAAGDLGAACALDATGIAGELIRTLGTGEQQARLLKPFLDEPQRRAVFCASERGPEIACVGEQGVLRGEKRYVLGAASAQLFVVFAKGPELWPQLWIAERKGDQGPVRVEEDRHGLGLAEIPACTVQFEGAPAERLGEGDVRPALREALLRYAGINAARAVGACRAAFEHARHYADERIAFGKPVGHFQAIAFLLADMATELDGARALTWRATRAVDLEQPAAGLLLAQAAVQAREAAAMITSSAVQILGGAGFVQDHPVEKWMRDARALSQFLLPAEAAQALAASAQLGEALADDELFCFASAQPALT